MMVASHALRPVGLSSSDNLRGERRVPGPFALAVQVASRLWLDQIEQFALYWGLRHIIVILNPSTGRKLCPRALAAPRRR